MKAAKFFRLVTAGLGATLIASSATAVTIQSSVANYGYQLIDLNPNDGIDATVTFTSAFSQTLVDTCGCGGGTGQTADFAYDYPPTVSVDGSYGSVIGTAGITPSAYTSVAGANSVAYVQSSSSSQLGFTLSANTKIVFTGTASASTTGYSGEQGTFGSSIGVGLYDSSLTTLSSYENVRTSATAPGFTEAFLVEYSNTGTTEFNGEIGIQTVASVNISAVPEPSAYSMLAAGLLISGVAARRQKRR